MEASCSSTSNRKRTSRKRWRSNRSSLNMYEVPVDQEVSFGLSSGSPSDRSFESLDVESSACPLSDRSFELDLESSACPPWDDSVESAGPPTEYFDSDSGVLSDSSTGSSLESMSDDNVSVDNVNFPGGLSDNLKEWAIHNKCTQRAINGLLAILIEEGHELPKDCRTLLQTKSYIPSSERCGGDYIYLGLKKGMTKRILAHPDFGNEIKLKFNIDGLPLFKSSSTVLWPILASFSGCEPFLVALFCGSSKPDSLDDYLHDFITELIDLKQNGVVVNGKIYPVSIFSFICDAPARAWVKCIVGHTGYYSCGRCTAKGEWLLGRAVFDSEEEFPARTSAAFQGNEYFKRNGSCHQRGITPLLKLDCNLVKDFSQDFMHSVCLGVMRKILYFWKGSIKGTYKGKLPTETLNLISSRLLDFNGRLPSDFVRQPRSLNEVDRWKATELYSFLVYTGMVALRGVLGVQAYKHFLSLSIAIRLLCESGDEYRMDNIANADLLLKYFIRNSSNIYGRLFCVYNLHSLSHLSDDVAYYKESLYDMSAFPFENYLQKLKKFVRGKHNPLVQVCKRLDELDGVGERVVDDKKKKSKFGVGPKNSWFSTAYGVAHIVALKRVGMECDFFEFTQLSDFFEGFLSSSELGIYQIPNDVHPTRRFIQNTSSFKRKCVCLPTTGGKVVIPLLHDFIS